jgi:hypothetical protein
MEVVSLLVSRTKTFQRQGYVVVLQGMGDLCHWQARAYQQCRVTQQQLHSRQQEPHSRQRESCLDDLDCCCVCKPAYAHLSCNACSLNTVVAPLVHDQGTRSANAVVSAHRCCWRSLMQHSLGTGHALEPSLKVRQEVGNSNMQGDKLQSACGWCVLVPNSWSPVTTAKLTSIGHF